MKILFGVLLFVGACVSARAESAAEDRISYYAGSSHIVSPDGRIIYSSGRMALKRTLSPARGEILEETFQENLLVPTALTRLRWVATSEPNVFSTGGGGAPTGTITFRGPEWAWTEWTLSVQMREGTTVTGSGHLDEASYHSERQVRSSTRTLLYRQIGEMKAVSEDGYRAKCLEISKGSGGVSL